MKKRRNQLGDSNIIGDTIAQIRKSKGIKQRDFVAMLQLAGLDINPSSISKLEGQTRQILDKEIFVIAKVLETSIDSLFKEIEK